MHSNKNITIALLSLFIVPVLVGGALVLIGVDRNTSVLIIIPVILILMTIFLTRLYQIIKQSFLQYDNIFATLGFHKKRLFLILTTYQKQIGDSTLQVIYGTSRASYQNSFNMTTKLNCQNEFAIGYRPPININHLQELPNPLPQTSNQIKLFTTNPNWAQTILAQPEAQNAINNIFLSQNPHNVLSLINQQLLIRVLFNQIDNTDLKNLIKSIETFIKLLQNP